MDRSDPIRVVYADGDAGTRSTVARRLSDDAIEVVTAETLAATLDRVGAGGIDCVVAGDLPDGTGLDLREAVGKRRSELPVVLYPAEGSEALPSRSGNNERHYAPSCRFVRRFAPLTVSVARAGRDLNPRPSGFFRNHHAMDPLKARRSP